MFNIDWSIKIGKFKLMYLESVEVKESVDILADTATIKLPASLLNKALDIESKINVGDAVSIQWGYDGKLKSEFEGYLQHISTDDGTITLECEDAIWQTRVPVGDKEFVNCSTKTIIAYIISEINKTAVNKLSYECTYELKYDKFVISKANAYDVLKKLQEESKGNIYMKGTVLHFHPSYIEKFGDVTYDFAVNIEKSDLKYRHADDRKYDVEVEGLSNDGKRTVVHVGTTGGEKRSVKIAGVTDKATLKQRGEEELKYLVFEGYEGSITGWDLPEVHPGYSAKIQDADYEYKTGTYYVVSVTKNLGSGGIVKKVEIGRKL
jgi:hypothetical protein